MKILYCSNEQLLPLLGGGSAGNLRILEKMVERGHDLTVATPLFMGRKEIEERYGIRLEPCSPFYIHRTVKYRELKYFSYALIFGAHVLKLLLRDQYDLVFLRNCTIGTTVAPLTHLLRVPLSISMTDFITGFLFEDKRYPRWLVNRLVGMEKAIARSSDKLFVITPRMARELRSGKLPSDRVVVTLDGVDTKLFDPGSVTAKEKEQIYEQLGFRDRIVMFHGVIDPYHGSHIMQKIIELTLAHDDVNFVLIACGEGFKKLQQTIRSPRVRFLDFVPYEQVAKYIAVANVGLIPYKPTFTLNQVFTLKFLEYTAMGLPTVLFHLKSVEELFGSYPFTFFSDSVEQFSANIMKALTIPQSQEAIALIKRDYSWDVVTERMILELERTFAPHA